MATTDRVTEIVEQLEGTCRELDEVFKEGEEDDKELRVALDAQILQCTECGWWCEASDHNEHQVCIDCCSESDDGDEG